MANARLIARGHATDEDLNRLSDGHITLFTRLIVYADDYGRYTGSALRWRSELVPLNPYMSAEIILAIQHDLAGIGLVGFYGHRNEEYCQVFMFAQYQALRPDRLPKNYIPTPPREMWPYILHPRDVRDRNYEPPDMPYGDFKRECLASPARDGVTFPPSKPRPPVGFEHSAECPFGMVVVRQHEPPVVPVARAERPTGPVQGSLIDDSEEMLGSANEHEKTVLEVLHSIPGWFPEKFSAAERTKQTHADLAFLRDIRKEFKNKPVDLLDEARALKAHTNGVKWPAKARAHSRFRNWLKNAERFGNGDADLMPGEQHYTGQEREL